MYYLVHFTFRSGEFEQDFKRIFEVETSNDLHDQVHDYLMNYYGKPDVSDVRQQGNWYYYLGDQVGVKLEGSTLITNFEQLIREISI